MIAVVELLGDPDLDERLVRDAEAGCLTVEFRVLAGKSTFTRRCSSPGRRARGVSKAAAISSPASNRSSNSLAFIKCHLALSR